MVIYLKDKIPYHVFPRYKHCQETTERMIVDYIKDQLSRRQNLEGINKNLVKFLSCMCGIVEVRGIIVGKLELWLHNPKLMKSAQELTVHRTRNETLKLYLQSRKFV